MENIKILKKKIIYRSKHRGTKEMDLLLGGFVVKYIDIFSDKELIELNSLLNTEDEVIYNWYFNRNTSVNFPLNGVTEKFRNFKVI